MKQSTSSAQYKPSKGPTKNGMTVGSMNATVGNKLPKGGPATPKGMGQLRPPGRGLGSPKGKAND